MIAEQQISHSALRALIPLSNLSDEQLNLLLDNSHWINLYKGQVLYKPGDQNNDYFYLINGHLRILRKGFETSISNIHAGTDESLLALSDDQPRQDKVLAMADSQLLKINREFLEKLLCWGSVSRALLSELALDISYKKDYFWIKTLLESRLFYKIPPMNIYSVLNQFSSMSVDKGQQVIQQGEEGSCCYLLKKGNADVIVDGVHVAQLTPGTVFGEDALVTQNKRNASVVMATPGDLMVLEKSDFYQLLKVPETKLLTPGNFSTFIKNGSLLLDVRTQQEFEQKHLVNAINIPLHLSYLKSSLLDKQQHYICYAATEERARAAAFLLNAQGFDVHALQGGLNAVDVVTA